VLVTAVSAARVSAHAPAPVQAPFHESSFQPSAGAETSVTFAPAMNLTVH